MNLGEHVFSDYSQQVLTRQYGIPYNRVNFNPIHVSKLEFSDIGDHYGKKQRKREI